jgi:hypothetical protein
MEIPQMNRITVIGIAGLLAAGWLAPAAAQDPSGDLATARQIVKRFAGELQGELKAAVREEGFQHAIGVCKDAAPRIAAKLSAETGWRVARTALRLRNPANAPDPTERKVLNAFLERAAAGEPLAKMDFASEETGSGGGKSFRYIKAIPTGELCLTCHGANVDPELAARIRASYPEDQATGFEVGELRGAFTLSKPLD